MKYVTTATFKTDNQENFKYNLGPDGAINKI